MKLRQIVLALALVLMAGTGLADPALARGGMAKPPAVPTLVGPANGATDLPTTVTVRWFLSLPGETYRVQVSTNTTFSSLVLNGQVSNATGYTLFNLAKDTAYYWRVNASAGGQTSNWSPVWSFRTTDRQLPAVPTLVSPANGVGGLSLTPTLVWNASAGADSYDFQVALEPSFSGADVQWYAYAGTSIVVPGLEETCGTHFYWRVRARNSAGLSAWSEVRDFTIVP